MEFPCICCNKEVRPRQHAVQCDSCSRWQHRICKTEETISSKDEKSHADKVDENSNQQDVLVEETKPKVPDGGWGWMIVLGCLVLKVILGGFQKSNGLFYVKFLEKFGGSASQTAWVTSVAATVSLLVGPVISIISNKISCRKLTAIGTFIFVVALLISGYANSLVYITFTYGVIGGLGRSFLLTPLTFLLGGYFDKRRSFAFGLSSAGLGIGGFAITPLIEIIFQEYGFTGTYILLSGIACHLFICACIFIPADQASRPVNLRKENIKKTEEVDLSGQDNDETEVTTQRMTLLPSHMSSKGSVYIDANQQNGTNESNKSCQIAAKQNGESNSEVNTANEKKKKRIISFSILKDIRFVTLLIATFVFTLPTCVLFLPALAKTRELTDIQAAYLLSIVAGSNTVSGIISGFVLDLKPVRNLRPYIYNAIGFIQCITVVLFPFLQTFLQFVAVCILHGAVMGIEAAQRNVILVDILGVKKLPSSVAFLLAVQGLGTLIGPPLAGYLKDTYGKYDYSFYFGAGCVFLGSVILACGNVRNYYNKKKSG